MTRFDTPEGRLAEYLVEHESSKAEIHELAAVAWKIGKGYRSRIASLAERLKAWVEARTSGVYSPKADHLMAVFLRVSLDRLAWPHVAEIVAEELEMPGA